MNKKWIVLVLILVVAAALLLKGCAFDEKTQTPEVTATPEATAAPETAGEAEPTEIPVIPGTVYNPEGGVENLDDDVDPTTGATVQATAKPTAVATEKPTAAPTVKPTATPKATATPAATKAATAKPTEAPKVELPEFGTTEYEKYLAMSATQQEKFIKSFDSVVDFVNWYNDALAEFERLHPDIEINDGEIDIGDLLGD